MSASGKPRVIVAGSTGRMGRAVLAELATRDELQIAGSFSGRDNAEADVLLARADVMVENTHADAAPNLIHRAISAGVRVVTGTSGLSDEQWQGIDKAARERGVAVAHVAPMRIGGGLLLHLCEIAARYFDHVEIVEAHHAGKADAPSGTAVQLTTRLKEARGGRDVEDVPAQSVTIEGVRGGLRNGVRVHSIRSPGIFSRHEVIFSGVEERLTISYDEASREGYGHGAVAAIKKVMQPGQVGLISGMDRVLGLRV